MKRQLLIFIAMMLSAVASADETVKINGLWYHIYYNQYSKKYVAQVTLGNSSISSVSGDIVIPEAVDYKGIRYLVTDIESYAFIGSKVTSVVIPNSVTGIGYKAFTDCKFLTSVTGGNNILSIGDEAFSGCNSLTSANILSSVKQIGSLAFGGCRSLTSVTIGNDIYRIGYGAFWNCYNLTFAVVGEGVKFIDSYAFAGCTGLTDFYCSATSVPSTDALAFSGTEVGNVTLHVPEASVNAYKAVAPWNGFKAVVDLTHGIADVPAKAVLIQTNGGMITIQGADDGTQVSVFGADGTQVGSAISNNGQATVNTNLQPGSIAVVKIGEKSFKVIISKI